MSSRLSLLLILPLGVLLTACAPSDPSVATGSTEGRSARDSGAAEVAHGEPFTAPPESLRPLAGPERSDGVSPDHVAQVASSEIPPAGSSEGVQLGHDGRSGVAVQAASPSTTQRSRLGEGGVPIVSALPLRGVAGGRANTVGERASAVGERASAVGGRANTVGERASTVGERANTVGERASAAGGRANTAGGRANTAGVAPVGASVAASAAAIVLEQAPPVPLAVVAAAHPQAFTPEQMRALVQLGESFLTETSPTSPNSVTAVVASPDLTPAERWANSTEASDERFRAMFGYEAFNAMQLQRAREAYAEAKAK